MAVELRLHRRRLMNDHPADDAARDLERFQERAAIAEYDGGLSRYMAEALAREEVGEVRRKRRTRQYAIPFALAVLAALTTTTRAYPGGGWSEQIRDRHVPQVGRVGPLNRPFKTFNRFSIRGLRVQKDFEKLGLSPRIRVDIGGPERIRRPQMPQDRRSRPGPTDGMGKNF